MASVEEEILDEDELQLLLQHLDRAEAAASHPSRSSIPQATRDPLTETSCPANRPKRRLEQPDLEFDETTCSESALRRPRSQLLPDGTQDHSCPAGPLSSVNQPGKSKIFFDEDGFVLWRGSDRAKRACLGTTELNRTGRRQRPDLPCGAFAKRVKRIYQDLEAAGVPLCNGFAVYNTTRQRSEFFHIKFPLPPPIFNNRYLPACGLRSTASADDMHCYEDRFKIDYWGDGVLQIYEHSARGSSRIEALGWAGLLKMDDPGVLETGPVVLCCGQPCRLRDLSHARLQHVEDEVRLAFAPEGGALWFSVCIYALHSRFSDEDAMLLIGARVREDAFAKTIEDVGIRTQFLKKWQYQPPQRFKLDGTLQN